MLAKLTCLLMACAIMVLSGCGTATEPPGTGPLTVEEWRDLAPELKYDPSSFDRLKLHDPKLKDEQAWEKFFREVVIPERKIDIPDAGKPAVRGAEEEE